MLQTAEECRAEARRLEERAQNAIHGNIRSRLLEAAHRWMQLADAIEDQDFSELQRKGRKETFNAIRRAVRIYWENQKALPIPEHLMQLAAQANEALSNRLQSLGKTRSCAARKDRNLLTALELNLSVPRFGTDP